MQVTAEVSLKMNDTTAFRWEAHTCLPLVPGQSMSGLAGYRDASFHHVSVNVGLDMTPFGTVMQLIAGFRNGLSQHHEAFVLTGTIADLNEPRKAGKLAISFDLEGSNMLLSSVRTSCVLHRPPGPDRQAAFARRVGKRRLTRVSSRAYSCVCTAGCPPASTGWRDPSQVAGASCPARRIAAAPSRRGACVGACIRPAPR